jgi:arylsulfatase A-like enzyme
MIDTLRADHLGSYGYEKSTSPNLDELARDSITFDNFYAQSSWTRPSVASVMTGVHPRSHGVHGRNDALSADALTLPVLLQAAGYETVGFTTNGNIESGFGFGGGYDEYVHIREQRTVEIHQMSDVLNEEAFGYLERRDEARPFFLYLHATDPHAPYTPRSPFRERFITDRVYPDVIKPSVLRDRPDVDRDVIAEEFLALYDAEIAFNDHHFGILIRRLKELGLYESTLIVVMSDHGEEFNDHGVWEHGRNLYQEQLAVPFILKLPGQAMAGTRVAAHVQHVDVLPGLLDLLGLPTPDEVQGSSFVPMLAPGAESRIGRAGVHAVAHLDLDGRRRDSVVFDSFKMIRSLPSRWTRHGTEFFDLAADPREQEQIRTAHPVMAGYLLSRLRALDRELPLVLVPGHSSPDAELEERLRALGYIQ